MKGILQCEIQFHETVYRIGKQASLDQVIACAGLLSVLIIRNGIVLMELKKIPVSAWMNEHGSVCIVACHLIEEGSCHGYLALSAGTQIQIRILFGSLSHKGFCIIIQCLIERFVSIHKPFIFIQGIVSILSRIYVISI